MYTLSMQEKVTVVTALTEGNSIRSIERMTGIHRDTIMRLLVSVGERCSTLMDTAMRELPCRRVQCDEIWTFVGKKAKRVRKDDSVELGDAWIFVALDADTKLVPTFLVGKRLARTRKRSFVICTSARQAGFSLRPMPISFIARPSRKVSARTLTSLN